MKPNIVLINADDLGWGDLSCYGHPRNSTPFLDELASNGLRFTDFYMASPVCSPSRGAMMTGCYPPRISFDTFEPFSWWVLPVGSPNGIHPDEVTFPEVLKRNGYSTMIVGKWHCGDQPEFLPTNYGFDHFYGLPYSQDMGRQNDLGEQDGVVLFPDYGKPLPLMRDQEVIQEQPDLAGLTERYTEESVRFIREHKDEPFFLYLAHMYVHLPHYPQNSFSGKSANGKYGDCLLGIDWSTNVIYKELEKLGLLENTLIVFTSDNGSRNDFGDSNGPLKGSKRNTYEGGLRVPCIMYWKDHIAPGQVNSEIVSSLDFYRTFATLTGSEIPANAQPTDSLDFSGLILGQEGATSPRDTFFYYIQHRLEAVRHKQWKLHVYKPEKGEITELYDLEKDMGETVNIADQYPEIVAELRNLIQQCRDDIGDSVTGIKGKNVREKGWVSNPKPMTEFDPNHPYIIAMYDDPARG